MYTKFNASFSVQINIYVVQSDLIKSRKQGVQY